MINFYFIFYENRLDDNNIKRILSRADFCVKKKKNQRSQFGVFRSGTSMEKKPD